MSIPYNIDKNKVISEAISALEHSESLSRRAVIFARFLSLWPEIKILLRDDWPVKRIWTAFKCMGKVDFDYATFLRHVTRQKQIEKRNSAEQQAVPQTNPTATDQMPLEQKLSKDESPRPRLPKVDYEKFDLSGKGKKVGFTAEERRKLKLF